MDEQTHLDAIDALEADQPEDEPADDLGDLAKSPPKGDGFIDPLTL